MKNQERPRIVLVPYPAQGHFTPMLQLAVALSHHGFRPLIVTPSFIHNRIIGQAEQLNELTLLPIPDGLGENEPRDFFTIDFAMENTMPTHLEGVLGKLKGKGGIDCVIVDLLASWAIGVTRHHGIPVAGFWPAMLASYNLIWAIPDMIRAGLISEDGTPMHESTIINSKLPFLPSQPTLSSQDLPWLIGNPTARMSRFSFWLRAIQRSRSLPWLLVNSFPEQDPHHQPTHPHYPRVFSVGPLSAHNRPNPTFWTEDQTCMAWLAHQALGSVLYVAFGSWVSPISDEKIAELALGLEATCRPFIWVLGLAWRVGLPNGFAERVASQGRIVDWAPQREVLAHRAVGCFMTHCGWNSTVEAIEHAKPLVCCPVAGDQFVNCGYIVGAWRIGVRVVGPTRGCLKEGVWRVMEGGEGEEMKRRVVESRERIGREVGVASRTEAALTT